MACEHGRGLMDPKDGLLYCRLSIQLEGPPVAESQSPKRARLRGHVP